MECSLRFELDGANRGELILNEQLARQLISAANWVKNYSHEGEINPLEILRWPGVMSAGEQDLDIISEQLMAGLDEAIDAFIKAVKLKGHPYIHLLSSDLTVC